MAETPSYKDLAKRYGFEAVPPGVMQLTQLVARQDSDVDEIAKLISKDPGLRKRLLRVANPDAEDESQYSVDTVEDALMRNGIGCALLLAMGTPLVSALGKTFQLMLSTKLEMIDFASAPALEQEHLLGSIGFTGKAAGRVDLRMGMNSAIWVGAKVLGLQPSELTNPGDAEDAVGELLNIVTGNFKSNLCDAGLDCRLQTPQVSRVTELILPKVPGGGLERMAFRTPELVLFVDVAVNPWEDD